MSKERYDAFLKSFNEEIKKFEDKYNIKFNETYLSNTIFMFNEKIQTQHNFGKNLTNEKMKNVALKAIFNDSMQNFSKEMLSGILFSTDQIGSTIPVYPSEGTLGYSLKNDELKITELLTSFNSLINKFSLGYIESNNLSIDYNEKMGGIRPNEVINDIKLLFDDVSTTNIEKINKKLDHSSNPTNDLIDMCDKAVNEMNKLTDQFKDAEDYTEFLHDARNKARDVNNIHETAHLLNGKEQLTDSIEDVATSYQALRENYQKKSIFQKWFTRDGWKESSKINSMRKAMMNTLGYTSKNDFNKDMKNISRKGTPFTKDIEGIIDEIQNEFDRKDKKNYLKEIKAKMPKEKGLVDINERELKEKEKEEEKALLNQTYIQGLTDLNEPGKDKVDINENDLVEKDDNKAFLNQTYIQGLTDLNEPGKGKDGDLLDIDELEDENSVDLNASFVDESTIDKDKPKSALEERIDEIAEEMQKNK